MNDRSQPVQERSIASAQEDALRRARAGAARWLALFAIGCVLLASVYAEQEDILMPGPLSAAHSLKKECQTCHTTVPHGQVGWLKAIFATADPKKDSEACLGCHKIAKQQFKPHNLAREELERGTRRLSKVTAPAGPSISTWLSRSALPQATKKNEAVYCATCHREHKGTNVDLKQVSNGACQSCHVLQFKDFAKGHPEFDGYPYKRRTRIIFDHASHFNKHFPEAVKEQAGKQKIPNVCTDCHTNKDDKRLMSVSPFKAVCASCHLDQIVGAERATGPKGIAFLTLPGIDLETLKENGLSVGAWPEESEAEVTPFIAMLLSLDTRRKRIVDQVKELDLLDLSGATAEQLAAVEAFVWEFKSFIHQLSTSDLSVLSERIRTVTGKRIEGDLAAKLVAAIPRDVVANAQRQWLPGLAAEIDARPAEAAPLWETTVDPSPTQKKSAVPESGKGETTAGGRPAQPPATPGSGPKPFRPELRNNLLPIGQSAILDARVRSKPMQRIQANEPAATDLQRGWYIDPKGELIKGPHQTGDRGDVDRGEDVPDADRDVRAEDVPNGQSDVADDVRVSPEPEDLSGGVDAESWASHGGWYRQDFTIYYKPTGHADPFLRAWLNFSGKLHDESKDNAALEVFDMLTHKDAQGQCTKCHSVDQGQNGRRRIDWGTSTLADKERRLTTFLHQPHFGLLGKRGCLTCHKLNDAAKYQEAYKQTDPHMFSSNFEPMKKAQCMKCHNKKAARQDCRACHTYHIGGVDSPVAVTKVPGSGAKAKKKTDPQQPASQQPPSPN